MRLHVVLLAFPVLLMSPWSSHGITLPEASFKLAMDCMQQMNPNGSVVLAMNSITNGLAMLLEKARNQTAAEILKVAFGNNQRGNIRESKKQHRMIARKYQNITVNYLDMVTWKEGYTLNVQAEGSINQTDQMLNRNYPNDGKITEELNGNITGFTNGLINNVFEDGPQKSKLLLTNAMYLKADWKTFFIKNEKATGVFKVENDECKVNGSDPRVPVMMGQVESSLLNDRYLGATLLRLPFKENNLNFYAILPFEGRSTIQLARKLTASKWINIMNRLDVPQYYTDDDDYGEKELKEHSIMIPKFTATINSSLKKILQNLGIRKMFENDADFSYGIPLKVTEIKHQAVLTIDEQGAEGAGKTQMTLIDRSEYKFKANRPFYWSIANSMRDIYFIGLYKGPKC